MWVESQPHHGSMLRACRRIQERNFSAQQIDAVASFGCSSKQFFSSLFAMRAFSYSPLLISLAAGITLPACSEQPDQDDIEQAASLSESTHPGRNIWFNNAYGGEKFFTFLANHPDPSKRLKVGFEAVINTPRAVRFDQWGVINDPDCKANPAGGADICPDPTATGVVGIRKSTARGFTEYGVACAGCHAGFSPINPPANPNAPKWGNIHPTIGNQYAKFGAMFAANLDLTNPTDAVRALVFASWPDGTVDTTALFQDNINNPGIVTAFWEHMNRNKFDVGLPEPKLRNGQGGEDDLGGDIAALRVYTNIGVCFNECVLGAVVSNQPISIAGCRANCADFPPQTDLDNLTSYLALAERPNFPGRVDNTARYDRGSAVFAANCVSCHDNTTDALKRVLSNDEMNSLQSLGDNATNACRALGTNWDPGHIWAEFASDITHQRAITGTKGYRNMPLGGIWSTSPFTHNQSIGVWAPANATPAQRADAYATSMRELLSATRTPKVNTIPFAIGTAPAGTPLALVVNRDPATGALLCGDYVENRGHYFGSQLSSDDKEALIYYLRFQ
jgi:mono/diheme cytochrome c family protein